jgi:hypothetical protein
LRQKQAYRINIILRDMYEKQYILIQGTKHLQCLEQKWKYNQVTKQLYGTESWREACSSDKQFHAFFGTPRFKIPPLDHILSEMNEVHILPHCFVVLYFNIILLLHLGLGSYPLPSDSPTKSLLPLSCDILVRAQRIPFSFTSVS